MLIIFCCENVHIVKYDVVSLIELVESRPCLWDKTADCFKDKIEKQKAWREVYVFLEEEFLDKDKKEQQNTVCHTIYQKIKSIYAHAKVIIKCEVMISKFFEKSPYTSLLKLKSGCTQYSLARFLYRRLRYIRPRR